MKKRIVAIAMLVLAVAVGATSAFGGGGRFQLYLVNSGPASSFYNDSVPGDGSCDQLFMPSSLSTTPGTSRLVTSVGYAPEPAGPSVFSYTVPVGGGFTVKADSDAIVLKLWAFSGDGTCPGQNGAQIISWRLDCSGPTCGSGGSVSLSGGGYQPIPIPAGTPINTLLNVHFGVSSPVRVGAGDTITLSFTSDTWATIQWNAPNGQGVSVLSILTS